MCQGACWGKEIKVPPLKVLSIISGLGFLSDLINQGDPDIISYDERSFKVVTD